jgi:F0F1-type ATP synthase epsilon subunit
MTNKPQKSTKDAQDGTLDVFIRSKEKLLYSGVGTSVSSENERGPFDILYRHANFICLIFNYVIVDKGLPTEMSFQLEKGIMYVASGKVDIYVGI